MGKLVKTMYPGGLKKDEPNPTSPVELGELICTFSRFFPTNRKVRQDIHTNIWIADILCVCVWLRMFVYVFGYALCRWRDKRFVRSCTHGRSCTHEQSLWNHTPSSTRSNIQDASNTGIYAETNNYSKYTASQCWLEIGQWDKHNRWISAVHQSTAVGISIRTQEQEQKQPVVLSVESCENREWNQGTCSEYHVRTKRAPHKK